MPLRGAGHAVHHVLRDVAEHAHRVLGAAVGRGVGQRQVGEVLGGQARVQGGGEGLYLDPALNQPDGIHPQANAQQRLLDNAWPQLQPLLRD